MDGDAVRPPRGRIWLHATAVAALLAAGYVLLRAVIRADVRSQLKMVWWSIALSGFSTAVAIAAVLAPARRVGPDAGAEVESAQPVSEEPARSSDARSAPDAEPAPTSNESELRPLGRPWEEEG